MNILLVEDEPLIQRTLKLLLEKAGATVEATNNGTSAIKLIHNNQYDIVVCDLMLQDITGFDIIEESKKVFSPSDIAQKFVIITAYSSPQILEKAKMYNCRIYSKPFTDVKKVIDEIVKGDNDASS
ncbi:response regulator [Bacteriovorax sp. DB6_IX]|uniref:response regulator n=1 Tax=Bacteriovorax sp. DB6_IX TaxID=1353530 RepID=UPI00038A4CC1|nr:response regulator [Bacteriovorax sp. DB6_IX]EQC51155.1 response regulator receiver domain protein [Bacteriovorax sp. DB6_IX]